MEAISQKSLKFTKAVHDRVILLDTCVLISCADIFHNSQKHAEFFIASCPNKYRSYLIGMELDGISNKRKETYFSLRKHIIRESITTFEIPNDINDNTRRWLSDVLKKLSKVPQHEAINTLDNYYRYFIKEIVRIKSLVIELPDGAFNANVYKDLKSLCDQMDAKILTNCFSWCASKNICADFVTLDTDTILSKKVEILDVLSGLKCREEHLELMHLMEYF